MDLFKPSQFPNLNSHILLQSPPGLVCHKLRLPARLSDHLLLLAWATLLKSYIDEDELYFYHNGTPVAVNLQNSSITRDVPMQGDFTHSTAFNTNRITIQDSAAGPESVLQLFYNAEGDDSTLAASHFVPRSHLPEIALQFQMALKALLPPENETDLLVHPPRPSVLNPHPALLNGPALLHDLVRQCQTHSAVAIDFLDYTGSRASVTYAAMHDAAQKLARRLTRSLKTQSNVHRRENTVIPLLIPQTPDLYVTLLAILYSGAAFCPLNLDAPSERIKFVIEDVGADVLVTTSAYRHQIPVMHGLVVCVMDEDDTPDVHQEQSFQRRSPQDLAYVLYSASFQRVCYDSR